MQEKDDFFIKAEFCSAMKESLITMRIAYITYLYVGDEGSRSSETTVGVDGKKNRSACIYTAGRDCTFGGIAKGKAASEGTTNFCNVQDFNRKKSSVLAQGRFFG